MTVVVFLNGLEVARHECKGANTLRDAWAWLREQGYADTQRFDVRSI